VRDAAGERAGWGLQVCFVSGKGACRVSGKICFVCAMLQVSLSVEGGCPEEGCCVSRRGHVAMSGIMRW
jgi:hypothetical protein